MQSFLLIAAVLGLGCYGQLIVKSRATVHSTQIGADDKLAYVLAMFADPWVLSGLGSAVVSSVLWVLVVQRLDLSVAYPLIALSFVLVPIAAAFFLREPMSTPQLLGLALIVVGVSLSTFAR